MAKPDETVDKTTWHEHERLSEDFAMSEGNLETKYCGEVIGDEVQLRNRKQVTWQEINLETWQKTWKHNKETENKNIKT